MFKLRQQHSALTDLIQGMSPVQTHHRTQLQETIKEEGNSAALPKSQPSWKSYRSSISTITDNESTFFDAMSGEDFGAEEYVLHEEPADEDLGSMKRAPSSDTQSASVQEEDDDQRSVQAQDDSPGEVPNLPIARRTRLPARPPADEGSLFAVLKKNVGQVRTPPLLFSPLCS